MNDSRAIAYFSMEIGLEAGMPTYAGGLGLLAGDMIRAAADLKVPLIAVTLLHRKGYFYQLLDASGWQHEEAVEWAVDDFLQELPQRAAVTIEGRDVHIRAWKYEVAGVSGFKIPVYFLDTDLPENSVEDRALTHYLYGKDQRYRLCQEVILGIGGVRMLRVLGHDEIARFHMNEGHSSLLTLELLDEAARKARRSSITRDDIAVVREQCVFTTHTPVPAGHDQFPMELVERVLGRREIYDYKDVFCCEGLFNPTFLALNLSRYVNGVARKHAEISRSMFARYAIDAITNGVHAATWAAPSFQALYDRYLPGWRQDNFSLRSALSLPQLEVWEAHIQAKKALLHYVNRETNAGMDVDVLTIGFARRAAAYKRWELIFTDLERLKKIARQAGNLQLIFAGKAHPQDQGGKEQIQRLVQAKEALKLEIKIAYLANYDMELAKLMTSGVDIWLNTPQPPLEASGTSGMKAAINGVPSLSVLDGWWIEGHIEGVTGWAIGEEGREASASHDSVTEATSLYDKLERIILPMFYRERDRFLTVMLHAIALNGSFFNAHRMVKQYVLNAYAQQPGNHKVFAG
ncbi:MAG: alpha-glucan family phosphorylase [Acidobacteria bacterium]|nr:alpha-glucan family phosphorylase [Acidobacteriota bacterium]